MNNDNDIPTTARRLWMQLRMERAWYRRQRTERIKAQAQELLKDTEADIQTLKRIEWANYLNDETQTIKRPYGRNPFV
jgi:hypothetical protein